MTTLPFQCTCLPTSQDTPLTIVVIASVASEPDTARLFYGPLLHFACRQGCPRVISVALRNGESSHKPRGPTVHVWWRHQMETFSALLALCAGNSPVTGEFPPQRPVTQSFDVSLICELNKRLSKQSRGWWFETPSHLLWRHCNAANHRLQLGRSVP